MFFCFLASFKLLIYLNLSFNTCLKFNTVIYKRLFYKQITIQCQHIKIILITKKPMILQVIRENRKNLNTGIPGIDQQSRYPRMEKVDRDWNSHAQLKH